MRALRRLAALVVLSAPLALASSVAAVNRHANYHAVCPGAEALAARCHTDVVTDANGNPNATTSPTGYGPAQFHGAYSLPTTSSSLKTIAIVDAYDDPSISSDLAQYSTTYGLPVLPTCTSPADARACFIK